MNVASPVAQGRHRWSNWSGSVTCRPQAMAAPNNETELAEVVAQASAQGRRIRVVGSGHSFVPLCASDEILISLHNLTGLMDVDSTAGPIVGQPNPEFQPDADGANEFFLEINGSAPIGVRNVQYLNAIGGNLVDTLDVRPYADDTPRGWGIDVFYDEGAPDGDGAQNDRSAGHHHQVWRCHQVEHAGQDLRQHDRDDDPDPYTQSGKLRAVAHHQHGDVPALGSHRHPDPELTHPPIDGDRNDAVQPDAREEQSNRSE